MTLLALFTLSFACTACAASARPLDVLQLPRAGRRLLDCPDSTVRCVVPVSELETSQILVTGCEAGGGVGLMGNVPSAEVSGRCYEEETNEEGISFVVVGTESYGNCYDWGRVTCDNPCHYSSASDACNQLNPGNLCVLPTTETQCTQSHTVSEGESCDAISAAYGTTLAELQALNPNCAEGAFIQPNEQLCITQQSVEVGAPRQVCEARSI